MFAKFMLWKVSVKTICWPVEFTKEMWYLGGVKRCIRERIFAYRIFDFFHEYFKYLEEKFSFLAVLQKIIASELVGKLVQI